MNITMANLTESTFGPKELSTEANWYSRVFAFLNQIMTVSDPLSLLWYGRPSIGSPPSIPSDTNWHTVTMTTVGADNTGGSISGGGYLVPTTGVYLCFGANALQPGGATGDRGARIARNGAGAAMASRIVRASPTAYDVTCTGAAELGLTAGDIITLEATQNSGSALNVISTNTALVIVRIP